MNDLPEDYVEEFKQRLLDKYPGMDVSSIHIPLVIAKKIVEEGEANAIAMAEGEATAKTEAANDPSIKLPNFRSMRCLQGKAWKAWLARDGDLIMSLVDHEERGRLLKDNILAFLSVGIYEAALHKTFIHGPHLKNAEWKDFFSLADLQKLRALGEPLPERPITVYRGVTCSKFGPRGMSWTANPNTAAWFASRFPAAGRNPAVYSLLVRPDQILYMTNARNEEEVVIALWMCGRAKRLLPMPQSIKPGGDKEDKGVIHRAPVDPENIMALLRQGQVF